MLLWPSVVCTTFGDMHVLSHPCRVGMVGIVQPDHGQASPFERLGADAYSVGQSVAGRPQSCTR